MAGGLVKTPSASMTPSSLLWITCWMGGGHPAPVMAEHLLSFVPPSCDDILFLTIHGTLRQNDFFESLLFLSFEKETCCQMIVI